jgi:large subunit ribosomal protein L23Ae
MASAAVTKGTRIHPSKPPALDVKKSAAVKAQGAKKAALHGKATGVRKMRTSASFHRPKTLKLARKPAYARRSAPAAPGLDHFAVIRQPLATESAMRKMEDNNTLVFLCDSRASKTMIKAAVKELYEVEAERVNTLIRPDGVKKAYVRLVPSQEALEVAGRIGFI